MEREIFHFICTEQQREKKRVAGSVENEKTFARAADDLFRTL